MAELPLLFLDVDGVIVVGGEIASPDELASWLASLGTAFELVWNSRAGERASRELGPALGLPRLPFVDLAAADCAFTKLPVVRRLAGERAVAWIDDDLDASVHVWAARRPFPTLLVEADPTEGMTSADVAQLLAFAASLAD